MTRPYAPRALRVPPAAAGMRLDRFLARWYPNWSRSELARAIKGGQVTDDQERPFRASHTVRSEQVVHIWIPGLAAMDPPPPFPQVLFEDDDIAVVDKAAGMMCHPAGERFVYALIGLAKERWPDDTIDLVHRIDADTSGVLVIGKEPAVTSALKMSFQERDTVKEYEAIVRGWPDWDDLVMEGAIGPASGPVRIQMAVTDDGLPSWTRATVLGRQQSPVGPIARVRCQIRTGRTHQIRVHLAHAGFPLLGDRLYGSRCEVFLDIREQGLTNALVAEMGAPRHALHSARLRVPHPKGGVLDVQSGLPDDMARWWATPDVLPLDGRTFGGEVVPTDGDVEDEAEPGEG